MATPARQSVAMPGSVVVDTNVGETPLYEALVRKFDAQTVTRQRLDVGDVVLTADTGTVIVERKTWLDLASSLIDRRYVEQKARMLAVARGGGGADDEGEAAEGAATAVPLYVVEGALTGWSGKVGGGHEGLGGLARMTNAQVEAAVVMTSVRDGVPVLRSKDAAHTAELVCYLYTQLCDGKLIADGGAAASTGYAGLVAKKRRRDNMTTETTWEVMLAQVPGMSAHKATAVAKVYPSMAALAAASEAELAAVMVPPAGREAKAARRLGPAVAQRLAQL
jgi:ERCC4-type nuclease